MNWLIGLGNPGASYRKTRHNVGFMVVDEFAEICGGGAKKKTRSAHVEELDFNGIAITAVKPQLYMNRSGVAVATLRIYPERDTILVVQDDAALPFGRLRFKRTGTAGGQKGMADIIAMLKTQDIPRLKVGIGRDDTMTLEDFVLQPFSGPDRLKLPGVIRFAAEAVGSFFTDGVETAMNAFHKDVE